MLKFEPAEVLEVFTDTFDESKIGAVKARLDVSEQGQKFSNTRTFYPLDPNILQVPVKGEHVLCCEFGGEYYYISKLNRRKSAPENSNFGASAFRRLAEGIVFSFGKYFNPPSRVKKLFIREGDTIIQGRFGNSIRLGSNQHQSGSFDKRNLTESPNVKIVAGAFTNGSVYSESLVSDISSEIVQEEKSSVYLTTDEYVPYENVGVTSTFDNNSTYFKPQVIIQSDRIVFNSKGDDGGIGIYSRDSVEIKSANKVEIQDLFIQNSRIDSDGKIDIGSSSLVPAVLGNDDFVGFITILANQAIVGIETQRTTLLTASQGTETPPSLKLKDEIKRLEEVRDNKLYLSKKINVE
jgi:hypothetical protein